jgi:hypothetical protein
MKHDGTLLEETIDTKPAYERPEIKVMSETELLSAIQINAVGTSWWVMSLRGPSGGRAPHGSQSLAVAG